MIQRICWFCGIHVGSGNWSCAPCVPVEPKVRRAHYLDWERYNWDNPEQLEENRQAYRGLWRGSPQVAQALAFEHLVEMETL